MNPHDVTPTAPMVALERQGRVARCQKAPHGSTVSEECRHDFK